MIRFLGDTAVRGGGGGQRAAYEQHTRQSLKDLVVVAGAGAQPQAQAEQQQVRSSSEIDRAEAAIGRATNRSAVQAEARSAKQALDAARRAGGDKRALLALERKFERLNRKASDAMRSLDERAHQADRRLYETIQEVDQLGRALLGVPKQVSGSPSSRNRRALAYGYAQVGGQPINSAYAGKTFPLGASDAIVAAKYPASVEFTKYGFPNFAPYAIATIELPFLESRAADFRKADEMRGRPRDAGYTWHHVEDGKTLVLVPTDLHRAVRHTGGVARDRNVIGPRNLLTNVLIQAISDSND